MKEALLACLILILFIIYIQFNINKLLKARRVGIDLTKKNKILAIVAKIFKKNLFKD